MARLQDFQTVTPTSSDKLLVVQSQGQGLVPYGSKLDSDNPTGTGSLSLNRKANTTIGYNSTTEGSGCTASGGRSHAEGEMTTASGSDSHAEGYNSVASNTASHAEGSGTTASGNRGHAEGYNSTASGDFSHAEGDGTTASGTRSHTEGRSTQASGECSHSEGYLTTASGYMSHTEGYQTKATRRSNHVFGEYNAEDTGGSGTTSKGTYIEIVGNGTSTTPSNARTLDWSGNEVLAGGLKINGNQDVATLKNISADYYTASSRSALMTWIEARCAEMADDAISIYAINPNYSGDGFAGGTGLQPIIIYRHSSTVFRVSFPAICGTAYYMSNAWSYTKATMSAVTPT